MLWLIWVTVVCHIMSCHRVSHNKCSKEEISLSCDVWQCHNCDTTVTQPGGHDKIVTHPCHNCDTTPPPCWEYMEEGEVIFAPKKSAKPEVPQVPSCPPLNFESWFRSPRHTILTTGYYCDNLLSLNISILSQSTQNALHQYVNTNLLIFLQTVFPITYVYWHIENMGRVDWKINI